MRCALTRAGCVNQLHQGCAVVLPSPPPPPPRRARERFIIDKYERCLYKGEPVAAAPPASAGVAAPGPAGELTRGGLRGWARVALVAPSPSICRPHFPGCVPVCLCMCVHVRVCVCVSSAPCSCIPAHGHAHPAAAVAHAPAPAPAPVASISLGVSSLGHRGRRRSSSGNLASQMPGPSAPVAASTNPAVLRRLAKKHGEDPGAAHGAPHVTEDLLGVHSPVAVPAPHASPAASAALPAAPPALGPDGGMMLGVSSLNGHGHHHHHHGAPHHHGAHHHHGGGESTAHTGAASTNPAVQRRLAKKMVRARARVCACLLCSVRPGCTSTCPAVAAQG